jgi:hypothetical protein
VLLDVEVKTLGPPMMVDVPGAKSVCVRVSVLVECAKPRPPVPILPRTDPSSSSLVDMATVREISTGVCVTWITLGTVDPDAVTVTGAFCGGNVIVWALVCPVTDMVARLPLNEAVGEIVIVCAVRVRVVGVTVSVSAAIVRVDGETDPEGAIVSVCGATVRVDGVTDPEGVTVTVATVTVALSVTVDMNALTETEPGR